ncbi:MAG: MotA/TolQ/ExbB proton channel family protein [Proteobacteria bacterium]|nr:MotA/TolQ/ExbB proton channel family protein [Pseudomonadota bacterium]MCL2307131.1 MotA/TolQ/ExbB proton channel family protein [Pseudomonadota bacterium]
MSPSSQGFAHFLTQTDAVGYGVLAVLTAMSFLSWYLIAFKLWRYIVIRVRSRAFMASFRQVRQCADAEHLRVSANGSNPFARLLDEGFRVCQSLRKTEAAGFKMTSPDDYVSAALAHGVAKEAQRLESGMTSLASVASTAPFIGLFGTVWAIFHALQSIALSAQASLDKVAGPVGEALIMTAYGLFVSIPALLAYNAFVRLNRNVIGELERFAHTVFGLLGLGLPAGDTALNETKANE